MRVSTLVMFMLPFSALAAPTLVKRQRQISDLIFKPSDSIKMSPSEVINPSSQDKIEKREPFGNSPDDPKCNGGFESFGTWITLIS